MTTAWAHLPNAAHIDQVLASLKAYPGRWGTAWDEARDATWDATWNAARGAAQTATWAAARGAAWDAARGAAWAAVQGATWDAVWSAARDAVWSADWSAIQGAIATLIAYDDAGQFMKLPVEQLKAMYRLDPHPMYLLLQPAAVIFAGDVQ